MKRILNFLLIFAVILLSFSMAGCSPLSSTDKASVVKTAYASMSDNDKKTIKDWEKAKLEEYKADKDYEVRDLQGDTSTNIKDIDTYKVTFKVPNSVLGDIRVYVDKNAKKNIPL
jgi:outer membrane murein-binding lipoprotein Lpp